jgi:sulfur carrier protein
MHIFVNGADQQVPNDTDLSSLVERLGLTGRRIAVEVNDELVPRSRHPSHRLGDGDRIEIIHAVGGG